MRNCGDFINLLGEDISLKIFICLDDPSDLARATAVSKFWRRFVIENRLCKQLCLRISPDVSRAVDVVKLSDKPITESKLNVGIPQMVVREHQVFSHFACGLTSFAEEDCISFGISASTTRTYPDEAIENTTLATNGNDGRAIRYWSSEGASDPATPETLFYKLTSNLCLVSEIHIQPFQGYSSKTLRFHLGHLKLPPFATSADMDFEQNRFPNDMFILTYTSPEFPMDKTANIQKFQLPKPILCVGGILKIELLGRVQKKEMDGLYYICLSKVQVVGRPLSPPFDVDIFQKSGRFILKYYFLSKENRELPEASTWRSFSYL